jgi:tetratricopeptide (TPR) repeat protein
MLGNLALISAEEGRWADARERTAQAILASRDAGLRAFEAQGEHHMGTLLCVMGLYAEGREHLSRGIAVAREFGFRNREAFAVSDLGVLLRRLGDDGGAHEHTRRGLALHEEVGSRRGGLASLHELALLAADRDDAAEVERLSAQALDRSRALGDSEVEAETLAGRGIFLLRIGRVDDARADLVAALDVARRVALPRVELLAAAHLALASDGDPSVALATLAANEARVEVAVAMEARFVLWQATHDPAHLREAKRILDFLVEHAPPEFRESMVANVRLHREIVAAAREAGL